MEGKQMVKSNEDFKKGDVFTNTLQLHFLHTKNLSTLLKALRMAKPIKKMLWMAKAWEESICVYVITAHNLSGFSLRLDGFWGEVRNVHVLYW